MPFHVRSTSVSRRRRKTFPSPRRQMRFLSRLCRRGLQIVPGCTPTKPIEEGDGPAAS